MAFSGVAETAASSSRTIGRYFTIVSVVPSLVLVGWVFLVFATGPGTEAPSFERIPSAVGDLSLGEATSLIAAALVLALALHPIQFTLVQLLEGYWGTTALGRGLRERRTLAHLQRRASPEPVPSATADAEALLDLSASGAVTPTVRRVLVALISDELSSTMEEGYPDQLSATMPTRLGNVLRRYELRAGAAYDLPILRSATPLFLVSNPSHVNYLNDRRSDLDIAVRMSAMFVVATLVTFLAFLPHGLWVGLALVPLAGAWLSYRGAVTVAADYGKALVALSDLNRFRLYEALRLPLPVNTDEEKRINERWRYVSTRAPGGNVSYVHPTLGDG